MKTWILIASMAFLIKGTAFAAIPPIPVPRNSSHKFFEEGVFEGGKVSKAIWASLFFQNERDDIERWVFDFKQGTRANRPMPKFQIRYVKGTPSKLVLTFQTLEQNRVKRQLLERLASKSQLVREIVVYPPIDEGDTAVELVLRDGVLFSPRQPLDRPGRLLVDLKHS
jgi:hypothetical protein